MQKEAIIVLFLLAIAACSNNAIPKNIPTDRTIGVIGCSNTFQSAYGYRWAGGNQVWFVHRDNMHDMDSGSVMEWTRNGPSRDFWKTFDNYLTQNPQTSKVWWQLCIPRDQADITTEEAAPIIEQLRKRIPNVQIYVSPLSDFPDHPCEITGIEGVERAKSLAIELDKQYDDIHPGPILGPLYAHEIGEEDHCHPNEEGMGKLGRQLKEFFDDQEKGLGDDNS
ncbi:MAG TPA: SGNH/GDSL hydrolase family protein [Candidatus Nanoarchaeia archaeon]|nr:SGNH/GDSL hydrolase family protein [Candidatus Nanoarchaeia archaeon]